MSKCHDVQDVSFTETDIVLTVDDVIYHFDISAVSRRLLLASPSERERFDISPSGYGIHWPLIDEDLSIDGLLGRDHMPSIKLKKAA